MYTMRPDCVAPMFGSSSLCAFGNGVMYSPRKTKPHISLTAREDSYEVKSDERIIPVQRQAGKSKSTKCMIGSGIAGGQDSFNPTYAVAAVHTYKQTKRKDKKSLPGDALLDSILKLKHKQSLSGKGIGMKGCGFPFEGDWMGDNWRKQESNERRELLGTGSEHLGKANDFGPPDPYAMSQWGGGSRADKSSWLEPLKKVLTSRVVPELIRYEGIDDLEGRRKIGSGGGWAAHYETYAKTFKSGEMGEVAREKFSKQVAATIVDYVNRERRRHNSPDLDRVQRYRLGKAIHAYAHSKIHTDVSDDYFWDEVLPYILSGRLVAWGHIKTGGGVCGN